MQAGHEPPAQAEVTLILSFHDNHAGVLPHCVQYELEGWQVEGLISGLIPLARALGEQNRPLRVDPDPADRTAAAPAARIEPGNSGPGG